MRLFFKLADLRFDKYAVLDLQSSLYNSISSDRKSLLFWRLLWILRTPGIQSVLMYSTWEYKTSSISPSPWKFKTRSLMQLKSCSNNNHPTPHPSYAHHQTISLLSTPIPQSCAPKLAHPHPHTPRNEGNIDELNSLGASLIAGNVRSVCFRTSRKETIFHRYYAAAAFHKMSWTLACVLVSTLTLSEIFRWTLCNGFVYRAVAGVSGSDMNKFATLSTGVETLNFLPL